MEDLWRVLRSGIDLGDFANMAEYKRYLNRFNKEEEYEHRRKLLFANMKAYRQREEI